MRGIWMTKTTKNVKAVGAHPVNLNYPFSFLLNGNFFIIIIGIEWKLTVKQTTKESHKNK